MIRFSLLALLLGGVGLLAAQDAAGDKEKDKRSGPLPAHYKDIVTPDQKAKIYQIQDIYRDKIDVLTAQIKTLQAERDAACEAVLNAEQKDKLAKAKAEAAAKRATATKKGEAAPTDDAPAPKAAPATAAPLKAAPVK